MIFSRLTAAFMAAKKLKARKNDLSYYDLNAENWWKQGRALNLSAHLNQSRFKFIDHYIHNWQQLKVLDVGCGGGLACEYLARQGAMVSGVDLSSNSIEVAIEHGQIHQLDINYRVGAAEDLCYIDQSFDVVLCFDVLEHVADVSMTISEISRVLKKGGLFFFDTLNRNLKSKVVMIWLLEDFLGQIPRGLHDWRKFIRPEEVIKLLQSHGFGEIVMQGFDFTNGTSLMALWNLLWGGLHRQNSQSELFKIQINQDTSISYICKALKSG